jgi:hypothetical protein
MESILPLELPENFQNCSIGISRLTDAMFQMKLIDPRFILFHPKNYEEKKQDEEFV